MSTGEFHNVDWLTQTDTVIFILVQVFQGEVRKFETMVLIWMERNQKLIAAFKQSGARNIVLLQRHTPWSH